MRRAAMALTVMIFPSLLAAEAGRTSGALLTRTLGARAGALGQAVTADVGDIDSVPFNPAGAARFSGPVLSATYQNGLLDDSVGAVSYGHPLNNGGWYVGASALDAGTIDLHQSDGTTGSRRAQQDVAATLGLALGRYGRWSAGAAVKYLRSELAETATAGAVAGDAGLYWETPVKHLQLAAAIQNLGSDLQYENEKEPLPTTERVGISYILNLTESVKTPELLQCRYLFLMDGVKPKNDDAGFEAGLEIWKRIDSDVIPGWAAMRGGYVSATQTFTVGAGFKLWNISIDYALQVYNDIDNTHRVTLGYHFVSKRDVL